MHRYSHAQTKNKKKEKALPPKKKKREKEKKRRKKRRKKKQISSGKETPETDIIIKMKIINLKKKIGVFFLDIFSSFGSPCHSLSFFSCQASFTSPFLFIFPRPPFLSLSFETGALHTLLAVLIPKLFPNHHSYRKMVNDFQGRLLSLYSDSNKYNYT